MKTFYLKHPVSLGERTITELTLQDPHVRHLMRTDAYGVNTIAADVALCSALSGESEALLANLHIEDWALIRGSGLTAAEVQQFIFEIVTELMCMMPSLPYEIILDFSWLQLKRWHTAAVQNTKLLRGIT